VDQVVIRTGQDIAHIGELDQKLWVALACPTRGIEFDSDTLDLIDEDKDGRIRPPELIAACQWAVARVRDPQVLADGGDVLQLSSLERDSEQGALLHAEAERMLALSGQAGGAAPGPAQPVPAPAALLREAGPTPAALLAGRLEAAFREIHVGKMRGIPLLNEALGVRAVGFRAYDGHLLGVLVTPWFMNLILAPGAEDDWS